MQEFIHKLASGDPVPGGGGASALAGGIGVALCAMVANLTSGKRKYAAYQAEIEAIAERADISIETLIGLIQKDAEVFAPLASAYGIAKDQPDRGERLEAALVAACGVPLQIMDEIDSIADVLEALAERGSRLAISDVGVAASMLRAAMEGAALNVYANTRLMRDRLYAKSANKRAADMALRVVTRCDGISARVKDWLTAE